MEPDLLRVTRHGVGARLFVALWGGLALVDVTRPGGSQLLSGVAVAALAGACGAGQSRSAAAAIATTGWLVIDGFVQHGYGELRFDTASWWILAMVLAVVLTVAGTTRRSEFS